MPELQRIADYLPGGSQNTMNDDALAGFHTTVNCYLTSLLAMANCVGDACPEIGGLYRHRLTRLRSRLAFDSSPEALEEGGRAIEAELKEYAERAAGYVRQHGVQLRAAIVALEEIVRSLAQRQDFYGARLRQLGGEIGGGSGGGEDVAAPVSALLSCVESMSHETQSLVVRMHNELSAVERRLKETEVTDPLTGLMNRREMERQIEARKSAGEPLVLIQFQLSGEVNDEVARQVASRLASQFRHKDFVSRWTETEFMVLFQGPPDIARSRSEQIVPWIAGRYPLDSGESVQIAAEARLAAPELAACPSDL